MLLGWLGGNVLSQAIELQALMVVFPPLPALLVPVVPLVAHVNLDSIKTGRWPALLQQQPVAVVRAIGS